MCRESELRRGERCITHVYDRAVLSRGKFTIPTSRCGSEDQIDIEKRLVSLPRMTSDLIIQSCLLIYRVYRHLSSPDKEEYQDVISKHGKKHMNRE